MKDIETKGRIPCGRCGKTVDDDIFNKEWKVEMWFSNDPDLSKLIFSCKECYDKCYPKENE